MPAARPDLADDLGGKQSPPDRVLRIGIESAGLRDGREDIRPVERAHAGKGEHCDPCGDIRITHEHLRMAADQIGVDEREDPVRIVPAHVADDPADVRIGEGLHEVFGPFFGMLVQIAAAFQRMGRLRHAHVKGLLEAPFSRPVTRQHVAVSGAAPGQGDERDGIAGTQLVRDDQIFQFAPLSGSPLDGSPDGSIIPYRFCDTVNAAEFFDDSIPPLAEQDTGK